MTGKLFETIRYEVRNSIANVLLNRPEVHNAFDDIMIGELSQVFDDLSNRGEIRAVVVTGEGKSFCAGADLNWMRRVKDYSFDDNLRESLDLSAMLYKVYSSPKPTIARVNGAAIGGGTGLVAVCDIAVAVNTARFSFSEVKLGLIPACISPYVLKKCGEGRCREFFLTGERLSADRAMSAGLLNVVVPPGELDAAVDQYLVHLRSSGPEAITTCKELLRQVPCMSYDEVQKYTAEVIARIRVSAEGQEGMAAFLGKRKPRWVSDSD